MKMKKRNTEHLANKIHIIIIHKLKLKKQTNKQTNKNLKRVKQAAKTKEPNTHNKRRK